MIWKARAAIANAFGLNRCEMATAALLSSAYAEPCIVRSRVLNDNASIGGHPQRICLLHCGSGCRARGEPISFRPTAVAQRSGGRRVLGGPLSKALRRVVRWLQSLHLR